MAAPAKKMDPENCVRETLASVVPGERIATYSWADVAQPRAVALLLHGFRAHACYTFLHIENRRNVYGDAAATSFVRELNERGIVVASHDYLGHGRSTGLRAYFPSFNDIVLDAAAHAAELRGAYPDLPLYVVGHSLGGTVAIALARRYPDLPAGVCLSSAACEPPANMFGVKGKILASLSALLSTIIPRVPVLHLPKNTEDPEGMKAFEEDPLNLPDIDLRARVGPSGELDTLVNPDAAKRFIDGVASEDKTLFPAKGRWHNLFTESGKEEIWALFADWIDARLK
eukprot:IDg7794t1